MPLRNCWQECLGMAHLFVVIFLSYGASSMAAPILTDIIMSALCPDQHVCSQAIFLSGLQHAISGMGTMLLTPLAGDLSDQYGRKTLLMIPLTFGVIPLGVLACSRSRNFVYAYFVLKTVSDMISDGTVHCITMAYVADKTKESSRTMAIGILTGMMSLAFVVAVTIARFLSSERIFWVATIVHMIAVLYMAVFLDDPRYELANFRETQAQDAGKIRNHWPKPRSFYSVSSMRSTAQLLKRSLILVQIILITFFSNLGEYGVQGLLLYYLKARFQFEKRQFSDLMLIAAISNAVLQFLLMPFMTQYIGEHKLICMGLLASSVHIVLYGIAWSSWVPYVAALEGVLHLLALPCIGSIVSKEAGVDEQGKVQGLITSVRSLARVISPLMLSPLTALFLSSRAPFNCPGFSLLCAACLTMIAFIQACLMKPSKSVINIRGSEYVQIPTAV